MASSRLITEPTPPVIDCVQYVLVDKDLSDLVNYPIQVGEVFRATVSDSEGKYRSISGFRAPSKSIVELVEKFRKFVGGESRVLSVEEWADSSNGLHPIP